MAAILIRLGVHLLCLTPLVIVSWRVVTDNAGANPIEFLTRELGDWTLRLLLLTLTVRPLATILKQPRLLSYRRALGLQTFFYAVCHLLTYLWLDQFFDWNEIARDIAKRPFIFAGFTAFMLMVPLAATSTKRAIAYLGHKWTILHRLVYLAASAGLLHYWWLIRADYQQAWVYLAILMVLFGYRIVHYLNFRRRIAAQGF